MEVHMLLLQFGVFAGHTIPQPPQFIGSLAVSTLQPLAYLPSQLAVPGMQSRAGLHTPSTQVSLMQSPLPRHFFSSTHLPQSAPPQSTSVSLPSCSPLAHSDTWQTLLLQRI